MSGLPREVIKWLMSLDLSSSIRNVRRDFSNGRLVAEILSWYYDKEIQMFSYNNGSSLPSKLSNWQLIEKFFEKEKLEIPNDFIEGTIHCKPGAAIALLERLYMLLTNRELHYLPAKGRSDGFNDAKYQSQLPLYARSTTTRSIQTNLADSELKAEMDRSVASQKARAIIDHHKEQTRSMKAENPERFEYKSTTGLPSQKSTIAKSVTDATTGGGDTTTASMAPPKSVVDAGLREVKVKQRHPPTSA